MNNKKTGSRFEYEVADRLREMGWWVHLLTQNSAGQPADLIAVQNNRAVLIDCKVCQNNRFRLDRIEPNQESAFKAWRWAQNRHYLLVLGLKDGTIKALNIDPVIMLKDTLSELSEDLILQVGVSLERVMERVLWKGVG